MADESTRDNEDIGAEYAPVIVDLGKKSKKAIKNLKRGTGDTTLEVQAAIRQARLYLSDADKDKAIVPIVLIYERKATSKSVDLPLFRVPTPFDLLR